MKSKYQKNLRLKQYNYRKNGYYFVTVVANMREDLLLGHENIVEQELADLVAKTSGLSVDYKVVMPNHVYLIFVLENCQLEVGEIVRRLKAKISYRLGSRVWQSNYYEHVIRTDGALDQIREYIINNPVAEIIKFDQFYLEPINRCVVPVVRSFMSSKSEPTNRHTTEETDESAHYSEGGRT